MINILPLISGIGSGIVYGLTGWAKSGEKFDWIKIGTTVTVGAVCGLMFTLSGIAMDVSWQMMSTIGIVVIVENIFKTIKKKWFSKKKNKKK